MVIMMKVILESTNDVFGIKFWGIRVYEDEKVFSTYNVRLSEMKQLEVAKTLRSGKRVVKWLNTDEGQQWLKERIKTPSYTQLGAFL